MVVSTPVRTSPLAGVEIDRDQLRLRLGSELLTGSGIEIGALHLPMQVPEGVTVRYVDRMDVVDLRKHYAELAALDLTPVDIIDDGEALVTIPDESVDFIIANHFMEHCQDPIATIGTHLTKLRPGGKSFYAIPDKRYTFDWQRDVTPLSHLIEDHEKGPAGSRSQHYWEWVRWVDPSGADPGDMQDLERAAKRLETENYSVHFHVWTQAELLELMLYLRQQSDAAFDIAAFRPAGIENIVVLHKHVDPADGR